MSIKELLMEYENYSIDKKLVLFNRLFYRSKNFRVNRRLNVNLFIHQYLLFKQDEIIRTAFNFILQAQEEKPYIVDEVSKRIYETVEYIGQSVEDQINLHSPKISEYLFIADQIKQIASKHRNGRLIDDNFDLINSFSTSETNELYEAVCNDLIFGFHYLPKAIQTDLQESLAFAADFFVMHYENEIADIISKGLLNEINEIPIDETTKKVVSYYLQVAKMQEDKVNYEQNLAALKDDTSDYSGRSQKLKESYKLLYETNMKQIILKHGFSEFKEAFMQAWGWYDETQPKRIVKNTKFTIEDLFVIVRDMGIPCSEIFKDNKRIEINKEDIIEK
ncbi:hypothetical protein [Mesobacillus foraminis]|uniref:hypothetical protein n=1 Tax=Mesobacillus foraminis TaxID=279826 RepID=UPI000EF455E4|nr:hypothetical protein [Mesobacillus foraminis]